MWWSAGTATLAAALNFGAPGQGSAQHEGLCRDAHRFLVEEAGMVAVAEADTIDDWRTRSLVPGCRVTAAGLTARSFKDEATRFYERLRGAEWSRTPDPRDAPNEASLRFRRGGADCLFNFYSGGILGTEAEATVDDATVPAGRQRRYNFLVLCIPAREAAPRDPAEEGGASRGKRGIHDPLEEDRTHGRT